MLQTSLESSSTKRYKYYLFYLKKDGSLYAYTDKKILAKAFKETRDMSIFLYTEEMLTSLDLRDIHEEAPDTLLEIYTFHIGKTELSLSITLREKLSIEHVVVQTLSTSIYCCASVTPEIFTDKIKKCLEEIKYVDIYKEYHKGMFNLTQLTPDYLTCFLHLYGNTMRKRW